MSVSVFINSNAAAAVVVPSISISPTTAAALNESQSVELTYFKGRESPLSFLNSREENLLPLA